MKMKKSLVYLSALAFLLAGCAAAPVQETTASLPQEQGDMVEILLQSDAVTVNGKTAGTSDDDAVYTANDIVYYEDGKDFTYGEGSEKDAHTAAQAAAHTVVHITKPGTYSLSGTLPLGQIAVDLGKDAKDDPNAVVTLLLNGVDITCEVAPAVIFYNVYECGDDDTENAGKDVDTSAAGANVIVADGTVNTVTGSYVERIYEPESVVLNAEKTEVEDADKLHKYDGAFYSKMSMNIYGGEENTGILNIHADNEGLDTELHLTINGGNIFIESGNDGINTNEDGVSVTTVNGGNLTIKVTGETGEGDGIDSNGWLVINGGTVTAAACANSADAGIDSDMGIHITGGTVIATGHMLDRIEDGSQNYAVFHFAEKQTQEETALLRNQDGEAVMEVTPENAYSILVYSSSDLKAGSYTLWSGDKQLSGVSGAMVGGPGMKPEGEDFSERPDNMQPPAEGQTPPDGQMLPEGQKPQGWGTLPEGATPPEDGMQFEGGEPPQMPDGERPERPDAGSPVTQEATSDFIIRDGGNTFSAITFAV